jgi:ABC-type transport system involved in Fe-S cluster assembly fused permease/ATPase subunit
MAKAGPQPILNYLHIPITILYYCCSLYAIRNATPSRIKRRHMTLGLIVLLSSSYLVEALYLAYWQLKQNESTPTHTLIHVISALLVWIVLAITLSTSSTPLWHPYAGAFSIEITFQIAFCATTWMSLRPIHLSLSATRFMISLALLGVSGRVRVYTDEEAPLIYGNGVSTSHEQGIGSPNSNAESSGVFSLSRYAILLPYLWPKAVKGWFAIRVALVMIARFTNFATPQQEGILLDQAVTAKGLSLHSLAWWIGLQYLALGCKNWDNWASTRISAANYINMSNMALSHTLSLSRDHLDHENTGELVQAANQANSVNSLIELVCFEIFPTLCDLVLATVYLGHVFGLYLVANVLALALGYVSLSIKFTAFASPARRVWNENSRKRVKVALECISHHPTITYFNRVDFERNRYANAVTATMTALVNYSSIMYIGQGLQGSLVQSGYLLAATVVLQRIANGKSSIGTFVAFLRYWNHITGPVKKVSSSFQSINGMLIDAERLLDLLNLKSTVVDPEPVRELVISAGKVIFQDTQFSYDDRQPVLRGASFVVEPGSKVAFVGETGSGKSTILRLLFRFYDVKGGSITIDGQDVRSVTLQSLREALGIVSQMPDMFDTSVMENVRYGRLNATDKDVIKACKSAAIHEKIMSFPEKYKSMVGERGLRLSGGELQRIAIARVLLKNPRIVILDEATSAVDTGTEASIQAALDSVFKDRTKLVVAHRLSTIVNADTIMVLDGGKIVERGTHDELLKKKGGKYHQLWEQQTTRR